MERGCRYVDNAEPGGSNRIFGGGSFCFLKRDTRVRGQGEDVDNLWRVSWCKIRMKRIRRKIWRVWSKIFHEDSFIEKVIKVWNIAVRKLYINFLFSTLKQFFFFLWIISFKKDSFAIKIKDFTRGKVPALLDLLSIPYHREEWKISGARCRLILVTITKMLARKIYDLQCLILTDLRFPVFHHLNSRFHECLKKSSTSP